MLLQLTQATRQLHAAPGKQLLQTALWACQRHGVADQCQSLHETAVNQQQTALRRDDEQQQQQQQQQQRSWREKLIALSSLTLYAQGNLQQLAATSFGSAAASAASVAAAAAAAAAAPAGTALAYFQIQNERSTRYWLRQVGLADRGATHGLMAANIAAYALQMISPGFTRFCVRSGPLVADGEYWRLLTAAFLHGNIVHCGVNMLALYNIGHTIEGALGSKAFMAVYLGSAVGGNLTSQLMGNPFVSSMGASGALFGILGGYVAYKVKNRHTMPLFSQDMMSIAGMLAFNFALMWMFNSVFDHWAHVGGLLSGALISAVVAPRYRSRW